jgi:hypothetical protein
LIVNFLFLRHLPAFLSFGCWKLGQKSVQRFDALMDWTDFAGRSQNILSLAVILFELVHFAVGWFGTLWTWVLTV